MEIIKHGDHKRSFPFRCNYCGQKYNAPIKVLDGDFYYSKCPYCGQANEADMACSEEEGEAL